MKDSEALCKTKTALEIVYVCEHVHLCKIYIFRCNQSIEALYTDSSLGQPFLMLQRRFLIQHWPDSAHRSHICNPFMLAKPPNTPAGLADVHTIAKSVAMKEKRAGGRDWRRH